MYAELLLEWHSVENLTQALAQELYNESEFLGATLKEQKKAGIWGLAHGICNTTTSVQLEYPPLAVTNKLEIMAFNLCRFNQQYHEGKLGRPVAGLCDTAVAFAIILFSLTMKTS